MQKKTKQYWIWLTERGDWRWCRVTNKHQARQLAADDLPFERLKEVQKSSLVEVQYLERMHEEYLVQVRAVITGWKR
jgi:hypothetical protein